MPAAATAAPLVDRTLQFDSDPDDGDGSFDALGASGRDGLQAPDGVFVDGVPFYLEVCDGFNCDSLSLGLRWTVGPLLSFTPGDPSEPGWVPGVGTYRYGAGTLTLNGFWDSHPEPAIFVASITSLIIDLTDEGLFGIDGTVRAVLGPGHFNASMAKLLGISRYSVGGTYGIDTDGAYFIHGRGYGLGDNYGPGLTIDTAVPEPALGLLLAAGVLGIAVYRRRAGLH
ncbi:MAG: hypothetical protein AB7G23_10665 [Vicinamibacterales bacterium]